MIGYTIKEMPRSSGKTMKLKLEIFETVLGKDVDAVLIAPKYNMAKHLQRYFDNLNLPVFVFSDLESFHYYIMKLHSKPLYVFIDEPFMLDEHFQEVLLNPETSTYKMLSKLDATIVGYGTRLVQKEYRF